MNSCLYVGQVRHRRFAPREHNFNYRLFYVCLDLDEINTVFDRYLLWTTHGRNIASFSIDDHLKKYSADRDYDEKASLVTRVRDYIEHKTGSRPGGKILLVTHMSYFGFRFNPVSFYYCYDDKNENVISIIAEVNNTPWGEQHCYFIPATESHQKHIKYSESKQFHVSPFMPMDIDYQWHFSQPDRHLNVHMENYREGSKMFDATLKLERKEISTASLAHALTRFPMVTMKVVMAIYFQALLLFIKRIPFFNHPDNEAPKTVKSS